MHEQAQQNFSSALGVLTGWLEAERDATGNMRAAAMDQLIVEHLESDEALIGLVLGFVSLSGVLLTRLEKATGQPPRQLLQDVALRYSQ